MRSAYGLFAFLRRFVIALVIVCLLSAGALALGDRKGRQEFARRHVTRIGSGILVPQRPAQPANFLLIGHDADGNSDTMMVVHVDPARPTPLRYLPPSRMNGSLPGRGQRRASSIPANRSSACTMAGGVSRSRTM